MARTKRVVRINSRLTICLIYNFVGGRRTRLTSRKLRTGLLNLADKLSPAALSEPTTQEL